MSDLLAKNYASFLVDSHITEHDPSFLTKLTPEAFASAVKRASGDSVIVYACCHNGNCYYPTKVGHMHKSLEGRDFFGETIKLLRKEGILPRAYYTVVYFRRGARENPEWRVCQPDGSQSYRRSWHCCPNSESYRQFCKAQIREICSYDIESIFIDMTFWPGICSCHNCRGRYLKETGAEFPRIVDWNSPEWVRFQRSRESWLAEFAHQLTAAAKETKPDIAVAHQFSPVLLGWMYGQTPALADASDIPSGDFYGGRNQHRFGAKVLAAFEKSLPFEFMTSRCVNLYDHTSTKSVDELISSCATTLANGGTYLLIDAINPDGTLEPRFYDIAQKVGETLLPFKNKLAEMRPKLCADTGLYFSMASYVRRDHNGVSIRDIMNPINNMLAMTDLKPLQEALGTAMALTRGNRAWRVVTSATSDLSGLKTVMVNDASFMDQPEVDRLRQFVREGGTLITTGMTSYYDMDGKTTGDFALKDVMGVSYCSEFSKMWNYLATEDGALLSNDTPSPRVKETTATVLGRLHEPLFEYHDLERFASYHSNPPGKETEFVGLSIHQYGKGQCIYLASSLMYRQQHSQQQFMVDLLSRHAKSAIIVSSTALPAVEVTLLRGTRKQGYLLCFVNCQEEAPFTPAHDLVTTIRLPDTDAAGACRLVSNGKRVDVEREGDTLTFRLPRLEIVEMIEIEPMKETHHAN